MRDESSNLGGIWDERTFNDRMQMGKNVLAGVGCVTHVSLRTETIYRQDQDNPKIRKGQFVALTVHSLLILLKFRGRVSKCILQSVI